jgi:hypothetical protein
MRTDDFKVNEWQKTMKNIENGSFTTKMEI